MYVKNVVKNGIYGELRKLIFTLLIYIILLVLIEWCTDSLIAYVLCVNGPCLTINNVMLGYSVYLQGS